jgi:hypothetical protein
MTENDQTSVNEDISNQNPLLAGLARGISIVLHPLFIFFYLFIVLVYGTHIFIELRFIRQLWMVSAFILITSALLPMGLVYLVERNLWLHKKSSRTTPLIIMVAAYILMFFFFFKLGLSTVFVRYLLSVIAGLVSLIFINRLIKISLHTISMGAALALLFRLYLLFPGELFFILLAAMVLAGLSGTSRLLTKEHSPAEVYTGYLFGFLVVFVGLVS